MSCWTVSKKKIYFVPMAGFEKEDLIFNNAERDDVLLPYCQLKDALVDHGYEVATTTLEKPLDNAFCIVALNVPLDDGIRARLFSYPRSKLFLCILEPPVTTKLNSGPELRYRFSQIFTPFDDEVDNLNYFKLYYPQPNLNIINPPIPFEQKKLCTMIVGNRSSNHPLELYSERKMAIDFFENRGEYQFDFYGFGWNYHFKNYKGGVTNKSDCLKNYKFCICYENMKCQRGYITEKIFDCFKAGCVPIYWGAENIAEYIPSSSFIDVRDFDTYEELCAFLISIDEQAYQKYLKSIQEFMLSSNAHLFSIDHFISTFLEAFQRVCDIQEIFKRKN